MSILDLSLVASEADCILSSFGVKTDGTVDDVYVVKGKFTFNVNNSAEAELLAKIIPGAKEAYVKANETDDWKVSNAVTPALDGITVELRDAKTGRIAIKGGAEISNVMFRASKASVVLIIQASMGGRSAGDIAEFAKLLRAPVTFSYSRSQQALFNSLPTAGKTAPLPEIGDIVCAADGSGRVYGRVVEVNEDDESQDPAKSTVILDDFGVDHVINGANVLSFWTVQETDDYDKLLTSLRGRCKRQKTTPSWSALTIAVGEAYASSGGTDTSVKGAHALTTVVIERAAAILRGKTGGAEGEPADAEPVEAKEPAAAEPAPRTGPALTVHSSRAVGNA